MTESPSPAARAMRQAELFLSEVKTWPAFAADDVDARAQLRGLATGEKCGQAIGSRILSLAKALQELTPAQRDAILTVVAGEVS